MRNKSSSLPTNWTRAVLDEICLKIQDGTHFSPKTQYQKSGQGKYLYVTAKNIRNEGLDLSNVTYIDEATHRAIYKRCNPEKGDVLLVKDGVKTGNVAINVLDEEFSLLSSVALLKPIEEILEPSYLKYFFMSPMGLLSLTGQMSGSAIKRVVLAKIRKSSIQLPPLKEQHRIVNKIQTLTTHSREAREALNAIPPLLDQFRQSVLAAAFRGELTADWRAENPDVESGKKLLERIKTPSPKPDVDTFESSIIHPLPKTWEWLPLGKLGTWIGGGTPLKKNTDFWKGEIPWISPKDMKVTRISDGVDHISEDAISQSSAKKIPSGSILFVVRGMILNHTFPVAITDRQVAINQDMKALVPALEEMQDYILTLGFFI